MVEQGVQDPALSENRPITALTRPISMFIAAPASAGIVLFAAAVAALCWANSPWWESYVRLWEFRIGFGYQNREIFKPLEFWINDGLMAIFFLLVGLEIKREVMVGELASRRKAALPIAAAFGGVVFPALIYSILNWGRPGQPGWGIPMATDIAFVAGVLALLQRRIPSALAIFLTALAIVDDIFAVMVIAMFYTDQIQWGALGAAAAILVLLAIMNRLGVAEPIAYVIPGVALWVAILLSGVHATIAGVLLAAAIPGRRFLDPSQFVARGRKLLTEFERSIGDGEAREEIVERLESYSRRVEPPLHRLEQTLRPWVSIVIMPLFAFANAGVRIWGHPAASFENRVTVGVLLGLLFGKPIGIMLFSWASARARLTELPAGAHWAHIHGAAWLAGIGFTMSLFVGNLAFAHSALLDSAKLGIFAASTLAGITGALLLGRKSLSAFSQS